MNAVGLGLDGAWHLCCLTRLSPHTCSGLWAGYPQLPYLAALLLEREKK